MTFLSFTNWSKQRNAGVLLTLLTIRRYTGPWDPDGKGRDNDSVPSFCLKTWPDPVWSRRMKARGIYTWIKCKLSRDLRVKISIISCLVTSPRDSPWQWWAASEAVYLVQWVPRTFDRELTKRHTGSLVDEDACTKCLYEGIEDKQRRTETKQWGNNTPSSHSRVNSSTVQQDSLVLMRTNLDREKFL